MLSVTNFFNIQTWTNS